jgi:hypothetical protein
MMINTPLRYVSLIFAAYSFIYFSMQRTETAYKLATVGGSLSLFIIYLSMVSDPVAELLRAAGGPRFVYGFILMTYGFFFSAYALYHFSMKFQNGRDEKTLVLDGVTVLASLVTFLFSLRNGLIATFFAFTAVVAPFYFGWRRLVRAFKN